MTRSPELVMFDFDGTLVESERLSLEVDLEILRDLGLDITEADAVEMLVGRSRDDVQAGLERALGRPLPAEWHAASEPLRWAAFEARLVPVEGVVRALERIAAPTCIVSNSSHDYLERCLAIIGLRDQFVGRVFSAEDVSRGKPAPDILFHAASALSVEPSACVVVEDSQPGVEAARAAGMHVFAFSGGPTPAERLQGDETTLFHAMSELPELIERRGLATCSPSHEAR